MKIENYLKLILLLVVFTACESDDDGPVVLDVSSDTVANLFAPQTGGQDQGPISGEFTKFDFATGLETTSNTDWDVAFRGTAIIINGGVSLGTIDEPARTGNAAAYIATGTFASVTGVDDSMFVQDSAAGYAIPTGSGNGWYTYDFMTNRIEPIPGRVLVIRTRDNRYAKVEILSYYKDAPADITPEIAANDLRYFTFNYVYQPNEGVTSFN